MMVGFPAVKAIIGNKLFPGYLDRDLARNGFDAPQTNEPADPDSAVSNFRRKLLTVPEFPLKRAV